MIKNGPYWLAKLRQAGEAADRAMARAESLRAAGRERAAAKADREAGHATLAENYADWQCEAYGWTC